MGLTIGVFTGNDGFHSISTAYGFLFYANSYNGYARDHEAAMNQAYMTALYGRLTARARKPDYPRRRAPTMLFSVLTTSIS